MKKAIYLALALALSLSFTVPASASAAAPSGFIGGTVAAADKNGYDGFVGREITANNSTAAFDGFTFVADNKILNAWYVNVAAGMLGTLEAAYKIGGSYYIVTFDIDGAGKYWIADSRGGCGANMVKIGAFAAHVCDYASAVTQPTCNDSGFTTYTCACDDTYVDGYVPALGHNYIPGDFEFIDEDNIHNIGDHYRHFVRYKIPFACSRCGDSYNEKIEIAYGAGSGYPETCLIWYKNYFPEMTDAEFLAMFGVNNILYLGDISARVTEYNANGVIYNTSTLTVNLEPWNYPLTHEYYDFSLSVDNGYFMGDYSGITTRIYNVELDIIRIYDETYSIYRSMPAGRLVGIDFPG